MSSRALAQRRRAQRHDVEAEVEILAELRRSRPPLAGRGWSRRRPARRPCSVFSPPTRVNSPDCSTRSTLACADSDHVADLVEEDRAAVGHLEQAPLARARAGEGAALVAEQLALDQLGRDRRAVDLDERLVARAALSRWMARAMSSLPVPRSPVISTRRARRRHLRDLRRTARPSPRSRRPSPSARRPARAAPATSRAIAPPLERVAQGDHQALAVERLLQEVVGARLGRAHRVGQRGVARDHDDRRLAVVVAVRLQRLHGVEPEIPGSCTSSSMTSAPTSGSRASASSPLAASSTVKPSPSSTMRTVRRMFFSSSTMRTVEGIRRQATRKSTRGTPRGSRPRGRRRAADPDLVPDLHVEQLGRLGADRHAVGLQRVAVARRNERGGARPGGARPARRPPRRRRAARLRHVSRRAGLARA